MTARLRLPEAQVREQLEEAIRAVPTADGEDVSVLRSAYRTWDKRNELLLERAFEKVGFLDSSPTGDYAFAMGLAYPLGPEMAENVTIRGLTADIAEKVTRLRELLANLDAYGLADTAADQTRDAGEPTIFVVHGHADVARLEVELLIRRATNLRPVVLSAQPNQGATLIEQLEAHLGSANFAVVIMTADDVGRANADGGTDQPRARQNVVLELGFAMGALGRRKVAILHEEGLDLPSDINGVGYYPLDPAGAWKSSLVGELNAAGISVDPGALI